MPSVTHDGRSFMIDGRRVWLASGRVPYARICRSSWAERIHAAKLAGLNTVETPVFWNRHEARPGKFDFTGDNDLRHFIDLIGRAGMYAVLGVGPFVGAEWDMGGLPPWLRESGVNALRAANGPFLEACSRYITAVAEQVRGWQVTAAGTGGPVLLLRCESEWTCGREDLAATYLGELTRYLREAGLTVPIVNSNNLWQSVEGQIDGWSGSEDMLATMRQLASVRPGQPRVVIDFACGRPDVWGREASPVMAPDVAQRRLAEIMAGGGQFNISTFCGGTNFGFFGGRSPDGPASFVTTAADRGAAVSEAGTHGALYAAVRRIAHLASRFGRVFANLDPAYQPIALKPADATVDSDQGSKKPRNHSPAAHGCSIVHAVGSQGGIAFIFAEGQREPNHPVTLLLPDGSSLRVPLGKQSVVWCLFGVNVTGRCRLDHANVSALGAVGQTLVCFGPAGSRAVISVNGSPVEAVVPSDHTAAIVAHEGLTLVIVSEDGADSTFLGEDAVFVGASGLSPDGSPIGAPGIKTITRISADGLVKSIHAEAPSKSRGAHERAALHHWEMYATNEYADGTSARYAAIDGPADLASLGGSFGYGWYRLSWKSEPARRARLVFPFAGDRLHMFSDGKDSGLVGVGPGAEAETSVAFRKGPQRLVILAENLGRFSGGANLGEGKGVFGDVFEAETFKVNKPKVVSAAPVEVLAFRSPLWDLSEGDVTLPDRLTWTFQHRRKTRLIVAIDEPPASALLFLNDKPIRYLDHGGPTRVVIESDQFTKGNNTIQIAQVPHAGAEEELKGLASSVHFIEAVESVSARAEMAFAKWEPPAPSSYHAAPKSAHKTGVPTWWRCTFEPDKSAEPLYLDAAGLTKGQIYVNGRHIGRYFVATADGRPVPPQDRYLIPAAWLKPGQENDLVIFDEHGAHPGRCRLLHDAGTKPA